MPSSGQKVITVRLPAQLYDALTMVAHDRFTSLNRLCVETMAKEIGMSDLVPPEPKRGVRNIENPPEPVISG